MTSKAISGQGMKVYIGTGNAVSVDFASDVWIEIGEVGDVTPPSPTVDTIDVTHLSSTIKEFIAGLIDAGEGTLNCNNVANDQGQLEAREALMARELRNFRFDLPTDDTPNRLQVKCLVTGLPQQIPTNDKVSLTINLKASSVYEWSTQ